MNDADNLIIINKTAILISKRNAVRVRVTQRYVAKSQAFKTPRGHEFWGDSATDPAYNQVTFRQQGVSIFRRQGDHSHLRSE